MKVPKTCSGVLEREKNLQTFLEEISLALLDPELYRSGKEGNEKQARKSASGDSFYSEHSKLVRDGIQDALDGKTGETWAEVVEMVGTGKLKADKIDVAGFVDRFEEEVFEELEKHGFVKRKNGRIVYTEKTERLIARKALEHSLKELKGRSAGEFPSKKPGFLTPSGNLMEFDEFLHCFDMIDIQESMVNEFLSSGRLDKLNFEKAIAREFNSKDRVVFVLLLDTSDSMRGEKLRGAVRAALALKLAAEKYDRNLRIYTFNHEVRKIRGGDLLNVVAKGRTNIASAIMKAVKIAGKEEATPVVFLVTDGEPTSPDNPVGRALNAAKKLGECRDARLNLIMLNRDARYEEFCLALARKVKKSTFVRLNPGDLSVYFLREFFRA